MLSDRRVLARIGLLTLGCCSAPLAGAVSITAQTMDCQGETGVATFDSSRLFKIQDGNCPDPTEPPGKR